MDVNGESKKKKFKHESHDTGEKVNDDLDHSILPELLTEDSVHDCILRRKTPERNGKTSSTGLRSPERRKSLPHCQFSTECENLTLIHFAQYQHPVKSIVNRDLPSLSEFENEDLITEKSDDVFDTQPCSSDEMEECYEKSTERSSLSSIDRNDTILVRGPSILRSYSSLSEDQRRSLIQRAFEMKTALVEELGTMHRILHKKSQELHLLRQQLEKGSLVLDGEEEALSSKKFHTFPLYAQREYIQGSAAQIHYRLAESQFYRLLDIQSDFKVTKVEYIVQPHLVEQFKMAKMKMKNNRGDEASFPVLAFHGTNQSNILPICKQGFMVPGESGFTHATDTGWYGRGVYFSEYPSYSMKYISGSSMLLLCQVLPGRSLQCSKVMHGEPLTIGYDSHMSPDVKELVIFNSHHILPSYIVHYEQQNGDFKYNNNENSIKANNPNDDAHDKTE